MDNNTKRIRKDGSFVDTPDENIKVLADALAKANGAPILALIRVNGHKMYDSSDSTGETINMGWQGSPFYWPVLYTSTFIE